MQVKEDSVEISDDGEFDEMENFEYLQEEDEKFVMDKYNELLAQKYPDQIPVRGIDQEIYTQAAQIVSDNAKGRKYLNQRIVTKDNQKIIPRWASNLDHVSDIRNHQDQHVDPDCIFGRIDPRENNV